MNAGASFRKKGSHIARKVKNKVKEGHAHRSSLSHAPEPRFAPQEEHAQLLPEKPESLESTPREYIASSTIANPFYFGFWATSGVSAALIIWFAFSNIGALAGWVTGAVFIALGLEPLVQRLTAWGLPRLASVATVVGAFLLVVAGFIVYAVPVVGKQAVSFINDFPDTFETFLNSDFFTRLDQQFQVRSYIDNGVQDFFAHLTQDSNVMSGFFNGLISAGSTIAEIGTGILIVTILSIYFLASLPIIKSWGVRLVPASRRPRVKDLTEKITHSVGQYVAGQALVAVLNASFALIVMLIIQAPFPQLLALFVLILAFIPLVGGVTAMIFVSLVCLVVSWKTALLFAICHIIYLQIEAYLISPRIMSKAVAVPGGLAIIAVAAGGALWGVLGAIIAIPVAASLLILVREVFIPVQDRR
ncbi:AI-2E family transporter [Rothia sp. ZJ932]|uniref:AI-2E family transporter n=1 Tax=Rothia sp. ZJ932 TaxID=2810516 RepID=UPI001967E14F|nr:AI-2E family transporter [Rothia sp. ZJ932]QRZ62285.1 AI-2E family transporter [Rothia sp. ZJ932]